MRFMFPAAATALCLEINRKNWVVTTGSDRRNRWSGKEIQISSMEFLGERHVVWMNDLWEVQWRKKTPHHERLAAKDKKKKTKIPEDCHLKAHSSMTEPNVRAPAFMWESGQALEKQQRRETEGNGSVCCCWKFRGKPGPSWLRLEETARTPLSGGISLRPRLEGIFPRHPYHIGKRGTALMPRALWKNQTGWLPTGPGSANSNH